MLSKNSMLDSSLSFSIGLPFTYLLGNSHPIAVSESEQAGEYSVHTFYKYRPTLRLIYYLLCDVEKWAFITKPGKNRVTRKWWIFFSQDVQYSIVQMYIIPQLSHGLCMFFCRSIFANFPYSENWHYSPL